MYVRSVWGGKGKIRTNKFKEEDRGRENRHKSMKYNTHH